MKFTFVFGTRPEIIKLSPLIRYLKMKNEEFILIHTGQHYDYNMDSIFLKELKIPQPDYNLKTGSGTHGKQLSRMIYNIEKILIKERPDITIVEGDTNSTLAGAITSIKLGIPVVHVEAGCRSFDKNMPEEINRICTDHISQILIPPDPISYNNLIKEGIEKSKIILIANTLIDAYREAYLIAERKSKILQKLNIKKDNYAILTLHRQENVNKRFRLKKILLNLLEIDIPIVFPIHPRTEKMVKKHRISRLLNNFITIKPLGYIDFLKLMKYSKLVFTDSGGIQTEANMLGKPCIVLRDTTEYISELKHGTTHIVGDRKDLLLQAYKNIEKNKMKYDYSKHIGMSKKIINKIIELHKKKLIKIDKKPLI